MINRIFIETITSEIKKKNSHICVGLDSDYERIPQILKNNSTVEDTIFSFNKAIIDKTHDLSVAYKSNVVFYAGYGIEGLKALQRTNEYIKSNFPQIKTLADCKRSEMKRSAQLTAKELFEEFNFDGFTATPWFGWDTIEPYTIYKGKAVFVLCHDSNPSAYEVQDVKLENEIHLYEYVTNLVCKTWNKTGNILIEAPLTYPKVLSNIYKLSDGNQFFMLAGLGAQGGDIKTLSLFKERKNFIVNASRSIIFASDKEDFAQKARDQVINYNNQIKEIIY